jgi:hypothetical protein
VRAWFDADRLCVAVEDGREVSVPIAWFDWLSVASDQQRAGLRIIGGGAGIWWDSLEDGISVPALFGLPEHP